MRDVQNGWKPLFTPLLFDNFAVLIYVIVTCSCAVGRALLTFLDFAIFVLGFIILSYFMPYFSRLIRTLHILWLYLSSMVVFLVFFWFICEAREAEFYTWKVLYKWNVSFVFIIFECAEMSLATQLFQIVVEWEPWERQYIWQERFRPNILSGILVSSIASSLYFFFKELQHWKSFSLPCGVGNLVVQRRLMLWFLLPPTGKDVVLPLLMCLVSFWQCCSEWSWSETQRFFLKHIGQPNFRLFKFVFLWRTLPPL